MKWRPNPASRQSGVAWLGDVPIDWRAKRLKYCVTLSNEKSDGRGVELPYIGLEHIESWTGKRLIATEKTEADGEVNRFRPGDVLFGKLRPYLAKAYRANKEGVCTGELLDLRPSEVNQDFLFYYLVSRDFIAVVDSSTYGAKMPRASWEFIGNLPLLLPPDDVQRAIAAFLDRETARIDALIAKKQRQIELLQEKRVALISHAVTSGLDSNVPMKDSGIEWLGKIPRQWEMRRLKYVSSINDEVLSEDADPEYELLYVDIGNVDASSGIQKKESMRFKNAPSRARRRVKEGDVIVSTVRTYLRAIEPISEPEENLVVSTGFAVVRPRGQLEARFAAYALRAPYFVDAVVARSVGVSYPAVNASDIADIRIALPPPSEQLAIAGYLHRETARIDALIAKVRESITTLREYRTALISAAVTGKIDVREGAA